MGQLAITKFSGLYRLNFHMLLFIARVVISSTFQPSGNWPWRPAVCSQQEIRTTMAQKIDRPLKIVGEAIVTLPHADVSDIEETITSVTCCHCCLVNRVLVGLHISLCFIVERTILVICACTKLVQHNNKWIWHHACRSHLHSSSGNNEPCRVKKQNHFITMSHYTYWCVNVSVYVIRQPSHHILSTYCS